jgi:hypothetical protein
MKTALNSLTVRRLARLRAIRRMKGNMALRKIYRPAVLKALDGSIAKWRSIVKGTGNDEGRTNCPLCKIARHTADSYCSGCPIYHDVQDSNCLSTPYTRWVLLTRDREHKADTPEKVAAAKDMLKYLVQLRAKLRRNVTATQILDKFN